MSINQKRTLYIMFFCWLVMVALGMVYNAYAQEATPEVIAPDAVVIDSPDTVIVTPDESQYERLITIVASVGMIVITLSITVASALNSKSKDETVKELGSKLEKSVPIEIALALLGAGVKLTKTETDDKELERFKQTIGITKAPIETPVVTPEQSNEPK